jgi:hypothetical protein
MDALTYGELRLPLVEGGGGPFLDTRAPGAEALAWVLNAGVSGDLPDLLGALERGEPAVTEFFAAERTPTPDELAGAAERWRRLTGSALGDDVYVLRVAFAPGPAVVPRAVLLELLRELLELRAGRSQRRPRLFTAVAPATEPGEWDEQVMRELEERAARADDDAPTPTERLLLLRDLERAGILEPTRRAERLRSLEDWGLGTLRSYVLAGAAREEYGRDPSRLRHVPASGEPWVSLEYFRHETETAVPGDRDDWLGFCERALRDAPIDPGWYEGQTYTHWADRRVEISWRRDDGVVPAVWRAAILG